jgi:hypothetical protein
LIHSPCWDGSVELTVDGNCVTLSYECVRGQEVDGGDVSRYCGFSDELSIDLCDDAVGA